jgi:hypothetical protein
MTHEKVLFPLRKSNRTLTLITQESSPVLGSQVSSFYISTQHKHTMELVLCWLSTYYVFPVKCTDIFDPIHLISLMVNLTAHASVLHGTLCWEVPCLNAQLTWPSRWFSSAQGSSTSIFCHLSLTVRHLLIQAILLTSSFKFCTRTTSTASRENKSR